MHEHHDATPVGIDAHSLGAAAAWLPLAESHLTRRLFGRILGHIERLVWHPT
jgi:hypothetical protein